jgi:hypothetical protein
MRTGRDIATEIAQRGRLLMRTGRDIATEIAQRGRLNAQYQMARGELPWTQQQWQLIGPPLRVLRSE